MLTILNEKMIYIILLAYILSLMMMYFIVDDISHHLEVFLMNYQSQLLVLTDSKDIIEEVKGKEDDVFRCSRAVLVPGYSMYHCSWKNVFSEPIDLHHTFQAVETINGEIVHVFRYPLNNLDHTIYVFFNVSPLREEKETDFIFYSPSMQHILTIINNVSEVDSTILLLGESGVGKSAVAELIHKKSRRKSGPFLTVNCGALPENLIESELFGYEPGAFTGGKSKGKTGLFEAAQDGTIFLDEIAELPYFMQSKLLDVIQSNNIRKVGGIHQKEINVRIMAATNKNLSGLVEEGAFREDLYYRLNVVPINIPPLRERKEDIPELTDQLTAAFNQKYGRSVHLPEKTKQQFIHKHWAGNIRELANTIERLIVTNGVLDHPKQETGPFPSSEENEAVSREEEVLPTLKEARERAEKELVLKAYNKFNNTYKAAQALGVDQSTISKKIKKYTAAASPLKGEHEE